MQTNLRRTGLSGITATLLIGAVAATSVLAADQDDKHKHESSAPRQATHQPPQQRQQPAAAPARAYPSNTNQPPPRAPIFTRHNAPAEPNSPQPATSYPARPVVSPANTYPTRNAPSPFGQPAVNRPNAPMPEPVRRPTMPESRPEGTRFGTNGSSYYRPPVQPREFRPSIGGAAVFHGNQLRSYTTPTGMRISHVGPTREVIVQRGDRTYVTYGANRGFVQRQITVRNQVFVQRTYVYGGVHYAHVYRPLYYRGAQVYVYTPVRYYRPDFYVWVGRPWTPVSYRWTWMSDPWYGTYGAYFRPYPVYDSPSLWLTDFLIAASLQQAYQSGVQAGANAQAASIQSAALYANASQGAPMQGQPLSDDIKQQISMEVQRQLAMQSAQATRPGDPTPVSEPPVVADRAPHTLVAFSSISADVNGQDCSITEGDVLQFDSSRPLNGTTGYAQVLWSKPPDCAAGNLVSIPVEQLQEMQNHMMENVNQGLQTLQAEQGRNGLPRLSANLIGSTQPSFAGELPPADATAAAELQRHANEANTAEQSVLQEANQAFQGPPAPAAAPPPPPAQPTRSIAEGQTIEDVIAILGNPIQRADAGKKTIFIYNNLKITFDRGRVNKIE